MALSPNFIFKEPERLPEIFLDSSLDTMITSFKWVLTMTLKYFVVIITWNTISLYYVKFILNCTKNSGWNSFGDQILYTLAMVWMAVCAHSSTILVRLVLRPKICCIIYFDMTYVVACTRGLFFFMRCLFCSSKLGGTWHFDVPMDVWLLRKVRVIGEFF